MLKLAENPPILHPDAGSVRDLAGTWWVAHTKPRNEKALGWDLLHRGIGYFLPMVQRTTFSGGRKRRGMMPLFASYVFVCGDEQSRVSALATDRVCRMVMIPDQMGFIGEIAAIERALAGEASFDPYPFAAVGRRVRVRRGPFEGIEGTIVQRSGLAQLVLQVGVLNCGAAMAIDPDLVEEVA